MRHLTTDVLDLIGMLALVVALVVLLWPVTVAGAIAAGGLGLIGISAFIDWRADRTAIVQAPEESA